MLVSFYLEITSTGVEHRDFDLLCKALHVLRQSTISGRKVQGAHFDQGIVQLP